MVRAQVWPECDEDIKKFVITLVERLRGELGNRLIGIYLHGSLAMGSYYRPKSDIDLIVVVNDRLEASCQGGGCRSCYRERGIQQPCGWQAGAQRHYGPHGQGHPGARSL